LNYLRTDYVPRRITGNNDKKLSPKTVYNLYISVASFFTWASREFNLDNPMNGSTGGSSGTRGRGMPWRSKIFVLALSIVLICR
jgi:hypothetical protein